MKFNLLEGNKTEKGTTIILIIHLTGAGYIVQKQKNLFLLLINLCLQHINHYTERRVFCY